MIRRPHLTPDYFDQFDCFGDYDRSRTLCAKHCALRIKCAIEQEHNIKMELLSNLTITDDMLGTIQ